MSSGPASFTFTFSGGDGERTAQDVHATLCDLVSNEAAKHEAWADYAAVLLDDETAAFFAARLTEGKGVTGGDESNPPSEKKKKKRKLIAKSEATESPQPEPVPEVSLRVACLDGTTLDVTLPEQGLVREVKRIVGQVRLLRLTGLCIPSRAVEALS